MTQDDKNGRGFRGRGGTRGLGRPACRLRSGRKAVLGRRRAASGTRSRSRPVVEAPGAPVHEGSQPIKNGPQKTLIWRRGKSSLARGRPAPPRPLPSRHGAARSGVAPCGYMLLFLYGGRCRRLGPHSRRLSRASTAAVRQGPAEPTSCTGRACGHGLFDSDLSPCGHVVT